MKHPVAPVPHVTHHNVVGPARTRVGRAAERVVAPVLLVLALTMLWATTSFAVLRPGVNVSSRAQQPILGQQADTGVAFIGVLAERGPTDRAVKVRNMTEYGRWFGTRTSWSSWDSVEFAFRTGVTEAWIVRAVGPAATPDTVTFDDNAAADAIAVDSKGAGATTLTAQIVVSGGSYQIVVADTATATTVDESPLLADNAAAVEWSQASPYVTVRALGANNPVAAAATALAGGDDDRDAITDDEREAALNLANRTLGTGNVLWPGATTSTMHAVLAEHAEARNRHALLDLPDSDVVATLTGAITAARAATTAEPFASGYGTWLVMPGITRNTQRVVAPSAIAAGLYARNDALTRNPNDVAAGDPKGVVSIARGISQTAFSDDDYTTLNDAGVNTFRVIDGKVQLFGARTIVDPEGEDADWLSVGAARLRMAIVADAERLATRFLFQQLDGRGRKVAEFNGALRGMLKRYWDRGALYGETAGAAYVVDTGPTVNTPDTLADNQLRAVIGIRTSPFAEVIYIEIVKVRITEELVAA